MPDPTKQAADERTSPLADDDSTTLQIPKDQVHPNLANSPHPDQTKTYPVVVNGKQENWTLEKLTQEAQTGAAGREKFQEAAAVRKENAKALAVNEDMELVFKGGQDGLDAFRRIGASQGVPGDQVEEIAKRTFASEDEDEDEDVVESYFKESSEADSKTTRSREPGPVGYDSMTPDVQRVLREAEKVRIEGIVGNALDKDETIAYNMKAQTPEGRLAIRQYVDEKIHGRLPLFNGDFGDGTRILAEVLPEIRTHLQALGTPGQRTHTGLGQAPGGGDTEVHPKTLPDHVPSTEGDAFEQNILEEMAFRHDQAQRGKL